MWGYNPKDHFLPEVEKFYENKDLPLKILLVVKYNVPDHLSLVVIREHQDGVFASHYHSSPSTCGIKGHSCLHKILPVEHFQTGCEVYRMG
jgi:hypothetical protein